ncbi:hypothetical protein GWO43_03485 [candidate division KSB1 bacterium]|nr:hypothetical protein [candidate division KSB1 bacterium]NIR70404.1 hypothetical protein [candidate division KSB1 bacterium]NIS25944.1 hypothetical protein [candidate division KSB1 bacterium]NIT69967.1 hypothetical protein [candidate division KSB1 bacterium]NIU26632.1 hypothetical protein [candidate division KSB1 bacterium]
MHAGPHVRGSTPQQSCCLFPEAILWEFARVERRTSTLARNDLTHGKIGRARGMGVLIRVCLLDGAQRWFIPKGEFWRDGVVEKFQRSLHQQSLFFEQKSTTEAIDTAN